MPRWNKIYHTLGRTWWLFLAAGLLYFALINWPLYKRVDYVSQLPGRASGQTTYLERETIFRGRTVEGQQWVMQTQAALSSGQWRVHRIEYDNAPTGRATIAPMPYRLWLGILSQVGRLFSARPTSELVEAAAVVANPLLFIVVFMIAAAAVARYLSRIGAVVFSLMTPALFPCAERFFAGSPTSAGLALACSLLCAVFLVAAVQQGSFDLAFAHGENGDSHRPVGMTLYILSAMLGTLGLWTDVSTTLVLLVGLILGAGVWVFLTKKRKQKGVQTILLQPMTSGLRIWAYSGALAVLLAYFIEFGSLVADNRNLQLIHPLYGLFWVGLVEVVVNICDAIYRPAGRSRFMIGLGLGLAVACVAVLPWYVWRDKLVGLFSLGDGAFLIDPTTDTTISPAWSWFHVSELSLREWSAASVVVLLIPAATQVFSTKGDLTAKGALVIAGVATFFALGFSVWNASYWGLVGVGGCVITASVFQEREAGQTSKNTFLEATAVCVVALLVFLGARQRPTREQELDGLDIVNLLERDLAHWLARRAEPGTIILAPPRQTSNLEYFGSLRGVGSLDKNNREGLAGAARIASASTPEEAEELVHARDIAYIVIPSWDSDLDQYATLAAHNFEGTFIAAVHRWALPSWLRPVAYQVPTISGFENQNVVVLEVVEPQNDVTSLSRTAEYFIEMKQLSFAQSVAAALQRFPSNCGAWVARAQVAQATNSEGELNEALSKIEMMIKNGEDRGLTWDRRVALAITLSRNKRLDVSKIQLQRSLNEISERKLRLLSPLSLYRLHVLMKAFDLQIKDEKAKAASLQLLTPDLRAQLKV